MIDQLLAKLATIPPVGAINRARRAAIIAEILRLMDGR